MAKYDDNFDGDPIDKVFLTEYQGVITIQKITIP